MLMNYTIRLAAEHDIIAMQELWKEFIDFHKDCDPFFTRSNDGHVQFGKFVKENILSPNWHVLVATDGEEVIGYCMATTMSYPPVYVKNRYGVIQDIAVSERYRRKGIGTALYAAAVEWLKSRGMDRTELEVSARNESSNAFWRKQGFTDFMHKLSREQAIK